MLLLLRQLYFFGNDDEDGPARRPGASAGQKDRAGRGPPPSASESDEWCEIDLASGVCDDRVRKSDVSDAEPRPMSRLRCATWGCGADSRSIPRVQSRQDRQAERTFVEHERLIVSDMFITTSRARTAEDRGNREILHRRSAWLCAAALARVVVVRGAGAPPIGHDGEHSSYRKARAGARRVEAIRGRSGARDRPEPPLFSPLGHVG